MTIDRHWKPIETAPKDGTIIDLWVLWSDAPARRANCKWSGDEVEGWELGEGFTQFQYSSWPVVTHWMPLPAPPSGSSEPPEGPTP
jgi:hypothetical protein